MIFLQDRNKYN